MQPSSEAYSTRHSQLIGANLFAPWTFRLTHGGVMLTHGGVMLTHGGVMLTHGGVMARARRRVLPAGALGSSSESSAVSNNKRAAASGEAVI
ncbi:MAG TPA: hypothetical protein VHB79_26850 [Polyangiaceae bacterium]|nr:hypothetical protein [Polyangiaceae bacterium]